MCIHLIPHPDVEGVQFVAIPGRDGYCAGDDGSLWSRWTQRHPVMTDKWRRLQTRLNPKGYEVVSIGPRDNRRCIPVHKLILTAFVGPAPKGMECCHKNAVRNDNRLSNIRWGTHSENVQQSYADGNRRNVKHHCKLTPEQVLYTRKLRADGGSIVHLAMEFGVTKNCLYDIASGKTWKRLIERPVEPQPESVA